MLNWLLMPDSLWGASHGRSVPSLGVFLSLYLRQPFFPRPPPPLSDGFWHEVSVWFSPIPYTNEEHLPARV